MYENRTFRVELKNGSYVVVDQNGTTGSVGRSTKELAEKDLQLISRRQQEEREKQFTVALEEELKK